LHQKTQKYLSASEVLYTKVWVLFKVFSDGTLRVISSAANKFKRVKA